MEAVLRAATLAAPKHITPSNGRLVKHSDWKFVCDLISVAPEIVADYFRLADAGHQFVTM
jgi:hypothetical protein